MASLVEKAQEAASRAYHMQAGRAGDTTRDKFFRPLPSLYASLAMQSNDGISEHAVIKDQQFMPVIRQLGAALGEQGLTKFSLLGRGGAALAFECREAPLVLRLSETMPALHPESEGLLLPAIPVSLGSKTRARTSGSTLSAALTPWVPTLDRLLSSKLLDLDECRQLMRQVRKQALERGFFPVDLDIDGLTPDDAALPRVLGNVGLLPDGTPVVVDLDALELVADVLKPISGATQEEQRSKAEHVEEVQAAHRDLPSLFDWRTSGGGWKTTEHMDRLKAQRASSIAANGRGH